MKTGATSNPDVELIELECPHCGNLHAVPDKHREGGVFRAPCGNRLEVVYSCEVDEDRGESWEFWSFAWRGGRGLEALRHHTVVQEVGVEELDPADVPDYLWN